MSNGTFPFAEISATAGADRLLINQQTQDGSLCKHDRQRRWRPAVAASTWASDHLEPHPFVIGRKQWQRFPKVQSKCVILAAHTLLRPSFP